MSRRNPKSARRWVGRPRRVTEDDIRAILEWQRTHETRRQLAARLKLSLSTVTRVVKTQGKHYKTPGSRGSNDDVDGTCGRTRGSRGLVCRTAPSEDVLVICDWPAATARSPVHDIST
jgi:hypothetical protein